MSKKKKIEENKIYKIFTFPERLNYAALILMILLAMAIGVTTYAFAIPQRSYYYIPDYEERIFAEQLNTYFRQTSSYSFNEDTKITKRDNVVVVYRTFNSNNKVTNVYTSCLGISKDDTFYYMAPTSRIETETSSTTSYIKSSANISGNGFKELYAKVTYDFIEKVGDETVRHPKTFYTTKETMITVSKKDLKKSDTNEFALTSEIFSAFNVTVENYNVEENETYTLKLSFQMASSIVQTKYHFDIQSFVVYDDVCYEIAGYYGVSNVTDTNYTQTISWPRAAKPTSLIAKGVFINANGERIEFFFKQPFSAQIKS